MAKKKRSARGQFVAGRSARRVKRRRNPDAAPAASTALLAPKANPPVMEDLAEFILPGFGGYAATRLLHRIVHTQISKRYPNMGKHAAAASTVLSFGAAWMLLHRIERLAKYQTPAVVGAGIASIQTLIQTYIPRFGWMVSDVTPEIPAATAPRLASSANAAAPVERLFPGGPEVVDETSAEDDLAELSGLGSLGSEGAEDYMDALN